MSLIRRESWDPFRELDEVVGRMSRLFGRAPLAKLEGGEGMWLADWAPTVNISETPEQYRINVELPGVDKKDVTVTLHEGVMTIKGERKQHKEEKGEKMHRIESAYGSFMRRFTMPEDADEEHVQAKFENGMLNVKIQRLSKEKAKPKGRTINVT